MSPLDYKLDLCREIRRIGTDFRSALSGIVLERELSRPDPGFTPRNLSLALPYYLVERFGFDGDLESARVMSTANSFGVAHFLAQDRLLDGDAEPAPGVFAFSDTCLIKFALHYASLFPASSEFWRHADSYVQEYFRSLAWEREVLWSGVDVDPDTTNPVSESRMGSALDMLGRKMSPLKCTTAAVSILSGHDELLDGGVALIENYHAAYQLSDDLADLSADAARGRWSIPLKRLKERDRLERPDAEPDQRRLVAAAVACGVYDEILDLIVERYEAAIGVACELGLESVANYIRRTLRATTESALWIARRTLVARDHVDDSEQVEALKTRGTLEAATPGEKEPDVPRSRESLHTFSVGSSVFVVDPSSCLFFEADEVAADVLSWIHGDSPEAGLRVLKMNHGPDAVSEALGEVDLISPPVLHSVDDASPPPGAAPTNIKSLALNVTSGCNLACDYCYLRRDEVDGREAMPRDVARRGVELLLEEASGEAEASLVFFGGEPLLERELVLETAALARERSLGAPPRLSLHMTTNGTMLDLETAGRLHELGVNVLVSLDGPEEVQDRHRRFRDGSGTYASVAGNVSELPRGMAVSARITLTPESGGVPALVDEMKCLGFRAAHLSPASGEAMDPEFARHLIAGFEELAWTELEAVRAGRSPFVGNFSRAMRALAVGRPRRDPCGAGSRYLCLAHDGTLYLCHRFVGLPRFAVGSVFDGIDRQGIGRLLSESRAGAAICGSCWARFLCGGPCLHDAHADGSWTGPDPVRCEVSKRVFELSMWLYASLPEDARRRLALSDGGEGAGSGPGL